MKSATVSRVVPNSRAQQMLLVVGASLLIAVCARLSVPLPFTPVPLTLANFAVLAVGLLLGAPAGAAACILYLGYGAAGLPVFSPSGPGGVAQLVGPTGGYLMAYPAVAYVAGLLARRSSKFGRLVLSGAVAEMLLFMAGISWLMAGFGVPLAQAAAFGLYPFFFGEVIKVMAAAGIASRVNIQKE